MLYGPEMIGVDLAPVQSVAFVAGETWDEVFVDISTAAVDFIVTPSRATSIPGTNGLTAGPCVVNKRILDVQLWSIHNPNTVVALGTEVHQEPKLKPTPSPTRLRRLFAVVLPKLLQRPVAPEPKPEPHASFIYIQDGFRYDRHPDNY